jgi:hypothetical protein
MCHAARWVVSIHTTGRTAYGIAVAMTVMALAHLSLVALTHVPIATHVVLAAHLVRAAHTLPLALVPMGTRALPVTHVCASASALVSTAILVSCKTESCDSHDEGEK